MDDRGARGRQARGIDGDDEDRRESNAAPVGVGGTIVGAVAVDGAVVAGDTLASRDGTVHASDVRKLESVHPTAVLGSTDERSTVQAVVSAVAAEADRYELSRGRPMRIETLGRVLERVRREQGVDDGRFLLGGVDDRGGHLLLVDPTLGVQERRVAAIGSGGWVALGLLEDDGSDGRSVAEARRLAARALRSAAERDVRTGLAIDLAEVNEDGVTITRYEDPEELA